VDAVVKGLAALLFCAAVALACWGIVSDSTVPDEHAQQVSTEQGTKLLTLDTSNAAQMHRYGLPTREDVMHYHVASKWAYQRDGITVELDELPGGYATWYELYRLGKWSDKEA
jgi:hypothetical protein